MNKIDLIKETLSTAWPAVLESFFISLAGMIDTMMVATLGTYAVSAVGLTIQPKFITLCFFFLLMLRSVHLSQEEEDKTIKEMQMKYL